MSNPSNGLGSWTRAKVRVLLVLSSLSANQLKARASEGWSSDIMTEVLGESLIAVMGSPLVSVGVSPTSAEFQVWQGGMTIQGGQFKYTVKRWDSNSMGGKGGHQGEIGVNSDGFLRRRTKGVSTPDLIATEFWMGCGQTDLASACVLHPLNRMVLYFKMRGVTG